MYDIKFLSFNDKKRVEEFNTIVHGEGSVDTLDKVIFRDPFNGPKQFAYFEENDKIIAMVGLRIHKQQFGDETTVVGEISAVGTLPQYRKRGLASRLINYWIEYMKEKEIPLCFLFGIANFYQQFGFEYAVPIHFYNYVNIDKVNLKDKKSEYEIVKLDNDIADSVIEEMKAVYDKYSQDNFCSEVRSLEYWKYRISTTNFNNHSWYIIKNQNCVIGYLWVTESDKEITIREANVLDEKAARAAAGFMYEKLSLKESVIGIGMKAPLNNSLAKFFYKWGAAVRCTNEIYEGSWAGMYKIVDLRRALELMVKSFEQRLSNSRFSNHTGVVNIKSEIGNIAIQYNNSKVDIEEYTSIDSVYIPCNILTSILTGYKDTEYYKEKIRFCDQEQKEILKVLFPIAHPYIYDLEMSEELD